MEARAKELDNYLQNLMAIPGVQESQVRVHCILDKYSWWGEGRGGVWQNLVEVGGGGGG